MYIYQQETPTPCPEFKRLTVVTAVLQVVAVLLSLYVAFKVYGSTKSMWKAFATWFGVGFVTFSIMMAIMANQASKHPCIMEASERIEN